MITQGRKYYHNSQFSLSSQMSPVEGRASSMLVKLVLELSVPFCRLQVLEQQVVRGEQAQNKDLKEKHKRRRKYAGGCSWWLPCRNPSRTAASRLSSMSRTPSRRRFKPRARCRRR